MSGSIEMLHCNSCGAGYFNDDDRNDANTTLCQECFRSSGFHHKVIRDDGLYLDEQGEWRRS